MCLSVVFSMCLLLEVCQVLWIYRWEFLWKYLPLFLHVFSFFYSFWMVLPLAFVVTSQACAGQYSADLWAFSLGSSFSWYFPVQVPNSGTSLSLHSHSQPHSQLWEIAELSLYLLSLHCVLSRQGTGARLGSPNLSSSSRVILLWSKIWKPSFRAVCQVVWWFKAGGEA